jgi:hypothetical protein
MSSLTAGTLALPSSSELFELLGIVHSSQSGIEFAPDSR